MRKVAAAEELGALQIVGHDYMTWELAWAFPPTDRVLRAQHAALEGLL